MHCLFCGANTGPWQFCDETCEEDYNTAREPSADELDAIAAGFTEFQPADEDTDEDDSADDWQDWQDTGDPIGFDDDPADAESMDADPATLDRCPW